MIALKAVIELSTLAEVLGVIESVGEGWLLTGGLVGSPWDGVSTLSGGVLLSDGLEEPLLRGPEDLYGFSPCVSLTTC